MSKLMNEVIRERGVREKLARMNTYELVDEIIRLEDTIDALRKRVDTNDHLAAGLKVVAWWNQWGEYRELWTNKDRADQQLRSWEESRIGPPADGGFITQKPLYILEEDVDTTWKVKTDSCGWRNWSVWLGNLLKEDGAYKKLCTRMKRENHLPR